MEQIIITRKDGTTYPLAVKKEVTAIKEARQSWGLLGDDVVNISVESPYPQHYEIGDHFNVFGRTYKLNQLPRVRKGGVHKYTYELTFEGVQYDLLRVFYDVTIETTGNMLQDVQGDSLTGDLRRFATVLVSNANRVFPGRWELGACPETIGDKTLTFGDGDNCLAVFQNLCKTFEVEADILQFDDICVINFYNRIGTTFPFVFEFGKGKGLYALDRQNVDSSNIVTRLKVFGSDDNITNKYRANRLCLPGKSKAQSFIEHPEAVQRYGIHEARKIFEDIKPTFNGRVSAIVAGDVLQFRDSAMFDLNAMEADGETTKYLIAGVSAKIHFNTGNLAGYEFDIHKYDHSTRTFTLKKLTDDRGDVFPSATSMAFQFAVGDEYKILDVTLPEQYQAEAEWKLQEQGNEYYRQNSQPKVKYGLSIAKSYLNNLFGDDAEVTLFSPGDYINVKDESVGIDKAIRIQSLQRNLLDSYEYTLTLSDVAENSITARVISELIDLDKITTTHNLKDPTRAKANWRSSREVMNMVFDPDGDYYTDKIKPNSIDTLALSVGAKSMQFVLQNVVFEPNYQGQKNVIRVHMGTLTHYTIEEQPRTWVISPIIAELQEDDSPYYIFAKCERTGNNATLLFSKSAIKVEQDANTYHFWIGVINSVDADLQARSIALSYGFSMISGRFIRTGRVESADGVTYFDLDDGEIGGRINFKDGMVSGLVGIGNSDRINAGMCGDGDADSSVRIWAGATKEERDTAPFRVLHDGTVYAEHIIIDGDSSFSGKVKGVTGSFKTLLCVNDQGEEIGSISFGKDGKMWFEGDLYSQGYNYSLNRGYRFYSSHIWCRGTFGASKSNTLIVSGNYGYFYPNGLHNVESRVYVSLQSGKSSNGITYYNIPLYGQSGDVAGFPVDLLILNAATRYNYCLVGEEGKIINIANANDNLSQYIYVHGSLEEIPGGAITSCINVGRENMIPIQDANILGAGWLLGAARDNNW